MTLFHVKCAVNWLPLSVTIEVISSRLKMEQLPQQRQHLFGICSGEEWIATNSGKLYRTSTKSVSKVNKPKYVCVYFYEWWKFVFFAEFSTMSKTTASHSYIFVATRLISFCLSYAKQLLHGKGVGTDGKQNITEKGHKQQILNLNKWRLVGLNGTYTYPNNDQVCLW